MMDTSNIVDIKGLRHSVQQSTIQSYKISNVLILTNQWCAPKFHRGKGVDRQEKTSMQEERSLAILVGGLGLEAPLGLL